jgi:hypothetical protein
VIDREEKSPEPTVPGYPEPSGGGALKTERVWEPLHTLEQRRGEVTAWGAP